MDNRKKRGFILNKHVKGRSAENLAQIYFLNKGYIVCSNISQHGCVDMIVMNEQGKIIKVDVKSVSRRKRDTFVISRSRTALQRKLDIKIMYVDMEKFECYFYKENINHLKRRTQVEKIL